MVIVKCPKCGKVSKEDISIGMNKNVNIKDICESCELKSIYGNILLEGK